MKLTPRLALILISFATALLFGVGALVYSSGRTSLEAATFAELQATSLEKSAALDGWVAGHKAHVTALSHSSVIREELRTFLESGPNATEARDRIVGELAIHTGPDQPYLAFFILSPDTGEVLIATNPGEEGKLKENQPYFIQGKITPFVSKVYYSLELQGPAITASAPLRTEDGQLLGVLAGRLSLEELNAIIQRRSGLRQTDDAFLVNTSNLFVTQPHLLPDPAVLQRGIHTQAVKQCLQTRSNGTLSTLDYRDIPSIITYRWLPEHEMCLIVKMNRAEALAPIYAFGSTIVWIALATLIAASVVALVLSRSMIRPILAMQTTAQRYGRGHLDIRLPEARRDELGQLAREFNMMAAALSQQKAQLHEYGTQLERKVEERTVELRESEARYRGLIESQLDLIVRLDPEGCFTFVNDAYCQKFGLKREEILGWESYTSLVHPEDLPLTLEAMKALYQPPYRVVVEQRAFAVEGVRWLEWQDSAIRDDTGELVEIQAIGRDITERKRAEAELQKTLEELKISNAELEQFAYVASHDLQEPLRMVSSYLQLLARRYQGKLDGDADEFIAFAVDGAKRMQNLINDLLAFSRVGTRGHPFLLTSCEAAMEEAKSNLQIAVEESGAIITHEPLPMVHGDRTQLVQLFQNLLGNAIKFRGPEPPHIQIAVRQEGSEWLFEVCDNGIGIDPKFAERIFVIFQRLHDRTSYPGTGIGLAICKRIVQRHGGRIWVDSKPDQGATFYFTIPIKEAS